VSASDVGADGAAENGKEYEHQANQSSADHKKEQESVGRLKALKNFQDSLLKLRVGVLDKFVHCGKCGLPEFLPLVKKQDPRRSKESKDKEPAQA
jgi:hypothetical protein